MFPFEFALFSCDVKDILKFIESEMKVLNPQVVL